MEENVKGRSQIVFMLRIRFSVGNLVGLAAFPSIRHSHALEFMLWASIEAPAYAIQHE